VLVAIVALARIAAADPKPDRAVQEAGDANLESESHRKGITLQAAVGGGLILGFGVDGVVGNGGSLGIRLGRVATEKSLVTLEANVVVPRHAVKATMGSETYIDADTSLLIGGQFYVNPALYLRVAGGLGAYHGEHKQDGAVVQDIDLVGPAGAVGAGVEIIRFVRWAAGLEIFTTGMINRQGLISSSGFLISVIVY